MTKAIFRYLTVLLPAITFATASLHAQYTELYNFNWHAEGANPNNPALMAQGFDGNIYGTLQTQLFGDGSVFGWSVPASTIAQIYGFTGPDGSTPQSGLSLGLDGSFYGTTETGGTLGKGSVFKITSGGALTQLYSFSDGTDGAYPWAPPIQGPDGSLYGVTQIGGDRGSIRCGCGTVFKLTPNSDGTWTKTTLYAFRGGPNDGAFPVDGLVFDRAGNIYSTTDGGGNNSCSGGCGTVFKLTPSSGGQYTESILHFFTGGSDGSNPISTMAIDGAGNLYGATYRGGVYGDGVAFEITP